MIVRVADNAAIRGSAERSPAAISNRSPRGVGCSSQRRTGTRVRRCAFWSDRYGSRGSASADRMPRYCRSRRHRHPIRPRRGARVLRARCSGAQCASGVTPTRAPRPPLGGSVSRAFAFPGRSRAEPRMVAGQVQHAPPRRVPWRAAGGQEPCRGHDDPCNHAPRGVTKETAMIPDTWRTQVCRKSRVSHSVSLP